MATLSVFDRFFRGWRPVAGSILMACGVSQALAGGAQPAYLNPSLPVDERVRDLVSRMTLVEKARQLDLYRGGRSHSNELFGGEASKTELPFDPAQAELAFGNLGIGGIHDLYPRPNYYNQLQAWIMKSNRLHLPAIFIEEGLHGYMGNDETVFPQSVNLATTWNPELARETGAAIAAEARADGIDMILAPVLDIARDPRWGRTE